MICVHVPPRDDPDRPARGSHPGRALHLPGLRRRHPDRRQHLPGPGAERAARAWRRPSSTSARRRTPSSTTATSATTPTTWSRRSSGQPRIEQLLRPGQTILCQVTKNPIGAKGARLTQEVSLPGRFVVLVPNSTAYGISKRLEDGERKRLRRIVDAVRPEGHGLIVRTAAAGASAEELGNDVERAGGAVGEPSPPRPPRVRAPALLYREPAIAVRVIREELNREYRAVVIDDLALYEQVRDYVGAVNPELADRVEYFDPEAEALPGLRAVPRPRAAPQGPRPQGVPALGGFAGHRPDRGAHRHRRQHRQERGDHQPGGDRLPEQPGGGRGGGPPAPAPGHRRDHRHRLHRHGDPGEPGQGGRAPCARPWPGTRPAPRSSTSPSWAWWR